MKAFKIFSMAAVAFMMVACSSEDTALDNTPVAGQKVHFTATIAAPGSDASTRTTYTEVTDPSKADYGKIKVAWKQNDEIALIHNGTKDVVTVQTLNADGSANISGDITVGTDGEDVTIVYPAASVDKPTSGSGATPADNATYATKWNSQDGTLAYIQDYLDFCRATSTLKISGTNATLSSNISLKSTIAIFKFTTKNSDGTATIDVSKLTVVIGSDSYVVTPAMSEFYVALPGATSQKVSFYAMGSDCRTYICSKASVTFTAGKYYQSTLKMTMATLTITSPAVNQVIGSDGKNYDYASLPLGVTPVARICYVNGSNGLALAMADEGQTGGYTARNTAAAHTAPFTGGTWKLTTQDEWNKMISGAGGCEALRDGFSSIGGTNLKWSYYWSDTERYTVPGDVYCYNFSGGYWTSIGYEQSLNVRSALAF